MELRTFLVLPLLFGCTPAPVSVLTETTSAKASAKASEKTLTQEASATALSTIAEVRDALQPLVGTHYPEAKVEVSEHEYAARFDTLRFTIHGRSKTGRISEQAYETEGPNSQGFVLRVSLRQGPHRGAAVVPQTLHEPYWRTFINAIRVEGEDAHLWVSFAYGQRVNQDFRDRLIALLGRPSGE